MITVEMTSPPIPATETQRLEELDLLGILDSLPEKEYDELTKLVAEICRTPVSAISLVDKKRVWAKSDTGLKAKELPRNLSFCAYAINTPEDVFIVPDARKDIRFAKNPLVTGGQKINFYAGMPLVTKKGNALGTLCVIDTKPRTLEVWQVEALKSLAAQVISLFELRKAHADLVKVQTNLTLKNAELEKFAYMVSHDIKSPLANIETVATILTEDYSTKLGDEGNSLVKYLANSSAKAKNLVDGILLYHTSDRIIERDKENIDLYTTLNSLAEFINFKEDIRFSFPAQGIEINTNRIALDQIFINLTNNAIKYNDKEVIEISYGFKEDSTHYHFTVKDNGKGIAKEKIGKIFGLFNTLNTTDRYGSKGTGIGLSTVKKLIENMGGEVSVTSTVDVGTEFKFSISK